MSLSGYEEPRPEDEEGEEGEDGEEEGDEETITASSTSAASAHTTPFTSAYASPPSRQPHTDNDVTITPSQDQTYSLAGELSPSPSQATPRPPAKSNATQEPGRGATTAPFSSPYENLKQETFGRPTEETPSLSLLPQTPCGAGSAGKSGAVSSSSPFAPPSTYNKRTTSRTSADDPLLHRVLDRNWRVQATPHSAARGVPRFGQQKPSLGAREEPTPGPGTARRTQRTQHGRQQSRYQKTPATTAEDDFDSSPAAPAPELHAEIFGSPARKGRVPGVSVLTPARSRGAVKEGGLRARDVGEVPGQKQSGYSVNLWDSDDDDDDLMGGVMSPPKTMQFHVPQSRLVQTPGMSTSFLIDVSCVMKISPGSRLVSRS